MKVEDPCKICLVQPMCKVACEEFKSYIYSYDWIYMSACLMREIAPVNLSYIADFMKKKQRKNQVMYTNLFDLKEALIEGNIIPKEK